jgi:hypothetical protein
LNWQSDASELKRKSLSLEKAENQSKSLPASKLQQLKGEVIDVNYLSSKFQPF